MRGTIGLIRYPDMVETRVRLLALGTGWAEVPVQRLDGWDGRCVSLLSVPHHAEGILARGQNAKRGSDGDLALRTDRRDHLEITRHLRAARRDGEGRLSGLWAQQQNVPDTYKHVPNRGVWAAG